MVEKKNYLFINFVFWLVVLEEDLDKVLLLIVVRMYDVCYV